MRAKKIILHIVILLLAIISMVSAISILKSDWVGMKDDYVAEYSENYKCAVADVVDYISNIITYRMAYSDVNKVIVKDSKRGNITVKDIIKISNDRNEYEIEEGSYASKTYQYMYLRDKAYRSLRKQPSKKNRQTYNYYKAIVEAIDEYNNVRGALQWPDDVSDILNRKEYLSTIYGRSDEDFKYYIEYKLGKDTYVVSNVEKISMIKSDNCRDICELDLDAGKFIYDKDSVVEDWLFGGYDYINPDSMELNRNNIKRMVFGVDKSFASKSTFYNIAQRMDMACENEDEYNQRQNVIYKKAAAVVICIIAAFIIYIMLLVMAGHKEKGDLPNTVRFDRSWIDLEVCVFVIGSVLLLEFIFEMLNGYMYIPDGLHIPVCITLGVVILILIEIFVLLSESFVRRIKTKSLIQTTLTGKIIKKAKKIIKIVMIRLKEHLTISMEVILAGVVIWLWLHIAAMVITGSGALMYLLLILMPVVAICYVVWKYFSENEIIRGGADKIAKGQIDYKITQDMKFNVNKKMKESVNSIGEGLNNAIEDSLKNERMKTELITNVSHDLKTPLTSIINYVDLLKSEGMDSENAKKYLDVLDKKSQRLKNLTEDLVEASKLNSGVIKFNKERIDVIQLLNQSLGEFEEKFTEKNLQIVKNISDSSVFVIADGRKTWRVFENLYGNIYKYAMPHTRVYIDEKVSAGRIYISLKNISESPLNVSTDELMERFVRGDSSRTTEGSGLGLSIARSIIEKQNGTMKIKLDGDLFKVDLSMKIVK